MRKRLTALLIFALLLLTIMPLAQAQSFSGSLGDNIHYEYDEPTQTLTLTGQGDMVEPADGAYMWAFLPFTTLTIGEGITSISEFAFQHSPSLSELSLPSTLKSVAQFAFGDGNLTHLELPEGLERIDTYAFASAEITELTLPSTLKYIGEGAFFSARLEALYIPAGVETIGANAFSRGNEPIEVYFGGDAPEVFPPDPEGYSQTFCADTAVFYPEGASGWSTPEWNGYKAYPIDYATELIPLEGAFENGWTKIDGGWKYVFNTNTGAHLLTGAHTLVGYKAGGGKANNDYYFNEDGSLFTGFLKQNGAWRFFCEKLGSGSPKTTKTGQMVKSWYVNGTSEGYISASEQAAGRTSESYYYYFDSDGKMYTGWHNDALTRNRWMYFGEKGSTPKKSILGRRYSGGRLICIGNNGEPHSYFFNATGPMFIGVHPTLGYFNEKGKNPASDLLGAYIELPTVRSVALTDPYGQSYGLLERGKTMQLTAALNPANSIDKTLKWTTSNKNVATISTSGKLTAVARGKAVITCTSASNPKATAQYQIEVINKYIYATKLVMGNSYDVDHDGTKEKITSKLVREEGSLDTVEFYLNGKRAFSVDLMYPGSVDVYMADVHTSDDYVELFFVRPWEKGAKQLQPIRWVWTPNFKDGKMTYYYEVEYFGFGAANFSTIFIGNSDKPVRVTGTGTLELNISGIAHTAIGEWDRYKMTGSRRFIGQFPRTNYINI